jgi:hypothetical protein
MEDSYLDTFMEDHISGRGAFDYDDGYLGDADEGDDYADEEDGEDY